MNAIKPRHLRYGDLIGVISPAGPVLDSSRIERGVRYLEGLGYRVLVGKHAEMVTGYLAGRDEERLEDFHMMFLNPEVRAVFCTRGGYGTSRLLPQIDYRLIARNPKILVGFSDITALQLALWKKCKLVTFHGPMVSVEMADEIDAHWEDSLWPLITSSKKAGIVATSGKPGRVRPGRARGRLLGGNLSLINSLLGTPYIPDFGQSLLFFEEISEEPYRIERMLIQLRNAGILQCVRGVVAGDFTDCHPNDPSKPSFAVEEILIETAEALRKPFIARLPIGHLPDKMTIPQGILARMDADKGTLEFLESAVSP